MMEDFNIEALIDDFQEKFTPLEIRAFMEYFDSIYRVSETINGTNLQFFTSLIVFSREIFDDELRKMKSSLTEEKKLKAEEIEKRVLMILKGNPSEVKDIREGWLEEINDL